VNRHFKLTRKGRAPIVTREWSADKPLRASNVLFLTVGLGILIALATTPDVKWSHELLLLAMASVFWVLMGMCTGEPRRLGR